jgi:putative aminopeptidase FrvX
MEVYGIRPGDPIMPDVSFEYHEENGIMYGKAFDNRLGCVSIIETMQALKNEADRLAVEVVGAFAAQEEVGTRGATVTAKQVQPDLAIVFEGSPADDFYFSAGIAQGVLKSGVQIRHMDNSYISNTEFIRYAQEIGDKYGIKYQDAVRRGGSTNAGKISLTGKAVPVLVLGIPSRYVHTHYNFCAAEDVDATVKMAVEVIRGLDEARIAKILRKDVI